MSGYDPVIFTLNGILIIYFENTNLIKLYVRPSTNFNLELKKTIL